MDQNYDPSRSNREFEQQRRGHEQPQGGGPPPQAQPPRQEMGGGPPRQASQGGQQGQPPHHGGGAHQGAPPQQQPPQQQPRQQGMGGGQHGQPPSQGTSQQPPRQGMQSQPGPSQGTGGHGMGQQGMGGQGMSQQGMGGQGMGGQKMGGPPGMQAGMSQGGMGGQRELPVEPVGAEQVSPEEVVTASSDDEVVSLVEKMSQADVGTVVITEDERPVGLVTDRGITMTLAETPDVSELTAADVMAEDLVTIGEDDTMFEAIQTLGTSGIRRAPVVDDEGNLAGIVSLDDAIVLLAEELDQVSEAIEQQIDRF